MISVRSITHTINRYRTLRSHRIHALPIVILMPHSACNCRCVMCDIWKGNKNLKQLSIADISGLLEPMRKLGVRQVLMSGGEALLNPDFFRFCELLASVGVRVSLLSTGLTLAQHAADIVRHVRDVIVSLDGDETLHNSIRNIPNAFEKMRAGIAAIHAIDPKFQVTGRTVIHGLNFRYWDKIVEFAKALGLAHISFLPADVSSHAFNREVLWSQARQDEILPHQDDLPELQEMTESLIANFAAEIACGFIAESAEKLRKVHGYYAAIYGQQVFPYKRCNAPWVSTVIEADGTVRPCFFHESLGNIKTTPLNGILNSPAALAFRRELDMDTNPTCVKCVCYLNLPPRARLR